jgi:hypothetical protein
LPVVRMTGQIVAPRGDPQLFPLGQVQQNPADPVISESYQGLGMI